ncbi:MAG: type IV pilus assembly protein PilM [Patescibacteria group bacterium]
MQNPLKQFAKIADFFKPKEVSAIGIDIGSSFIKVVQLKKKGGKAVLETYGELALGPYANLTVGQMTNLPAEKLAEAINDILKESNISTKNAALSIPFSASLISMIQLPKLSLSQLDSIIPIEARKYIPVPIGEVSIDWWVVPRPEEYETETDGENPDGKNEKIDVLIAAIHSETVSKYQDIVNRVGLENIFFEIEMFSTIRSTFGHDMKLVMVLDMGAGTTKLSIVEYGVVKSSHSVGRGSQDITLSLSKSLGISMEEAEKLKRTQGLLPQKNNNEIKETISLSTDYIFSEVNRVLLNYERKYNKTIGKVVLTGGGVLLPGFRDKAKEVLQAEIVYGDPFSKVEAPVFLENLLQEAGPEFAVAIGLALRKLQDI